ncbi:MAG: MarR family transcriptional regulator [Candidatus Hadarchaeum sp.]|uniref:MarR family transcriptional regulator n=1 Tax=Candidatus Hadarchaeum sp. TaxID=2883567 RepID=UPI003D135FE3
MVLGVSYVVLNQFYGTAQVSYSAQILTIEDHGQRIRIADASFLVENVEFVPTEKGENYYRLLVVPEFYLASKANGESIPPPAVMERTDDSSELYYVSVPAITYDQALESESPVVVSNITLIESKPVNTLPLAATLGVGAGLLAVAIWVGYRQAWGEAASTLIEHGLHDMTVRDVEIVGYIMERGEFTIPELMKLSSASKITVWRTVQRLVKKGLVVQTDRTRLSSNGLGGRGKPSRIYRYVGKFDSEEGSKSVSK